MTPPKLQTGHSVSHGNLAPTFEVSQFINRNRASDFILKYAPAFCVYCPLTLELYLDYDLFNVDRHSNSPSVVVLPKNHLSTVSNLSSASIRLTNYMLVTNPKLSKASIFHRKQRRSAPLKENSFQQIFFNKPLLPLIVKSDLKRIKQHDLPYLSISAIDVRLAHEISQLEISVIRKSIFERINDQKLI